jgi:long-subunit fatty acid transport protein
VLVNLPLILLLAILSISWSTDLHSQSKINSPYSMFGPGEVKGNEYFRNLGMGGISQGFRSNVSVNYLNPASYTAIDSLSFVFDGTVFSHLYHQKLSNQEQISLNSTLGNMNFAFPVTKRWKMAMGLLPWSQVGYKITDFQEDDINGRVNYQYEGSGGINQVYFGNALSLFKGLSVGVNASYLFGKTENRDLAFSDSAGFYRTAWSYSNKIGGLMLSYGLQWEIPITANQKLTLGATYTDVANLNMLQNRYIYRNLSASPRVDTLSISDDRKGNMEIPANLSAGVFMTFSSRFSAGIDYTQQNWSEYKTFDQTHNLNDAYQIRFGAIYKPRIETYSGYFRRLEYRAGIRYGKSFLTLPDSNQDFSELGISFGTSLPIRRSLSALNFGFEFSQRNSGSADLINENYYRFNIGINVYERWFMKRKFF